VGHCCSSHQVLDSSCSGWTMSGAMQHGAGHVMACDSQQAIHKYMRVSWGAA
jgi:hypothetical protein